MERKEWIDDDGSYFGDFKEREREREIQLSCP